jgi:hypothetical protein
MSSYSFRTSRPDRWSSPRPHLDATVRRMHYGPVQPMADPNAGWFKRWLKAG